MKYDMKEIMTRAWRIFRKADGITFGEALHRSWLSAKARPVNDQIIDDAKIEAGIVEETDTWIGWKNRGFEVIHGSKALFGASLIYGSKGDGAIYKARFFGRSQVRELATA